MIVEFVSLALVGGECAIAHVDHNNDLSRWDAALPRRFDYMHAKVRHSVVEQIWDFLLKPIN